MILSENIVAFHHYAIKAQNFQITLDFYKDLGFLPVHEWSLPAFKVERGIMLYNSRINTYIEVFDKDADIPTQGRKRQTDEAFVENALLHLCFEVIDAEKAEISAINAGAKKLSDGVLNIELKNFTKSIKVRNSLVYSPNGEVIEFLEKVDFAS